MFRDKHGNRLSFGQALPKIVTRFYNYYLDFKIMLLRMTGNVPSHSFRRLVYQLAGIKIGRGSTIHMWANFFEPKNIKIGEDTMVGDHAFLDGRASLTIGDHTDIASGVMIYNSEHDLEDSTFKAREEEVYIGDYVFIGPRVTILPGVKVGKGAVLAAGAVVTKDVAPFKIVGGVPAREIGERKNTKPSYRLGRARLFQ